MQCLTALSSWGLRNALNSYCKSLCLCQKAQAWENWYQCKYCVCPSSRMKYSPTRHVYVVLVTIYSPHPPCFWEAVSFADCGLQWVLGWSICQPRSLVGAVKAWCWPGQASRDCRAARHTSSQQWLRPSDNACPQCEKPATASALIISWMDGCGPVCPQSSSTVGSGCLSPFLCLQYYAATASWKSKLLYCGLGNRFPWPAETGNGSRQSSSFLWDIKNLADSVPCISQSAMTQLFLQVRRECAPQHNVHLTIMACYRLLIVVHSA